MKKVKLNYKLNINSKKEDTGYIQVIKIIINITKYKQNDNIKNNDVV